MLNHMDVSYAQETGSGADLFESSKCFSLVVPELSLTKKMRQVASNAESHGRKMHPGRRIQWRAFRVFTLFFGCSARVVVYQEDVQAASNAESHGCKLRTGNRIR